MDSSAFNRDYSNASGGVAGLYISSKDIPIYTIVENTSITTGKPKKTFRMSKYGNLGADDKNYKGVWFTRPFYYDNATMNLGGRTWFRIISANKRFWILNPMDGWKLAPKEKNFSHADGDALESYRAKNDIMLLGKLWVKKGQIIRGKVVGKALHWNNGISRWDLSAFEKIEDSAKPTDTKAQQQLGNIASTDLAKEGATALRKIIWFPYVGYGAGLIAGCYIAQKKGSGTWGYLGWSLLCTTIGTTVGAFALKKSLGNQGQNILDGKGKK